MKSLVILAAVPVGAAPFFAGQIPDQSLKVDVDLVMINATVTANEGHYVTGLQKKDFHVWEDKVEQQVEYLSTEDVPASVGLIVDVSLSMQSFGAYARQEALTFLQSLNEESEYFLMLFADKPGAEIDLTKDISKVQNITFIPYQCCTALYYAVYLGMEKIKKASYPKRALVVVTDGADNHSRFTSSNLKDFAREQNAQIFSIGAEGSINKQKSSGDVSFIESADSAVAGGTKQRGLLGFPPVRTQLAGGILSSSAIAVSDSLLLNMENLPERP